MSVAWANTPSHPTAQTMSADVLMQRPNGTASRLPAVEKKTCTWPPLLLLLTQRRERAASIVKPLIATVKTMQELPGVAVALRPVELAVPPQGSAFQARPTSCKSRQQLQQTNQHMETAGS